METKLKAAIIVESSGKSVELKESSGIFTCLLEHEVKATKATFEWDGPTISKESWTEMLAWFKWTYDTEKSEAQVRLFVHPELGWKIWAFPQNGGTGMTTREVENDESKLQRAAIPEGYIAFGTVHHHCSSVAFQSGVDLHDERNVDGLHITIGKMDEEMFDMHARLYIKGHRFEPNMGAFWDIGDDTRAKLEMVSDLGFKIDELEDRAARRQMCKPAPLETPFNDAWKTNYLLHRPNVQRGLTTDNGNWCYHCQAFSKTHTAETCPKKPNGAGRSHHSQRAWSPEKVALELEAYATSIGYTDEQFQEELLYVTDDSNKQFIGKLMELCADNFMNLDDIYKAYVKLAVEETKSGIITPEITEGEKKVKTEAEFEDEQARLYDAYLRGE